MCVGWQATLSLSPLFVSKLNKLGADVNGLNGKANVPQNSADFIARLKDIISSKSLLPLLGILPAFSCNCKASCVSLMIVSMQGKQQCLTIQDIVRTESTSIVAGCL